jgi:phosphoribosylformimino-5-aminoimidazole carboxamide ribotide isomerase
MIILPAIDLKDGKCVRLRQGRADDVTVYSDDPTEMARKWEDEGGSYLHVVDLDGAFEGHPVNVDIIRSIVSAIDMPVEVGGGLRTDEDVRQLLDAGVSRAIIGTRALSDSDGMKALVAEFGDRIAVGIDARDGKVQVKGWVETTDTEVSSILTHRGMGCLRE